MTNCAPEPASPQVLSPSSSPAPVPPPPTVTRAVWLMYAGAFVSLAISTVCGPWANSFFQAQLPRVLSHLPGGGQQPPSTAAALVNVLAIVVVAGALVGACLWLWMAWENRHGRSWARAVSTVFFGISCVIAASLATGSPVGLKVAGFVLWAIGLATVILLWRSASSQYFQTVKAARVHSA